LETETYGTKGGSRRHRKLLGAVLERRERRTHACGFGSFWEPRLLKQSAEAEEHMWSYTRFFFEKDESRNRTYDGPAQDLDFQGTNV
jgi:hypothetical protein